MQTVEGEEVERVAELEKEDSPAKEDPEVDVSKVVDGTPEDHVYKADQYEQEDGLLDVYPMRSTVIRLPIGGDMYFNWFTSLFGFVVLWGLSIWCMTDPAGSLAKLKQWKSDVSLNFTWFYIVANPSFTFFTLWLAIKYGDVKLGKKDEKPEFSDMSYFAMLFSAGVAVGLFFYGVAEPLEHQQYHWFANAGYHSQDEKDQFAMMITMYHWGFAGWSPYLIVAIAAGLGAYRFDLPLTMRSCLYELLGEYTWGWIGDVIDGFSIVATVAGICTSLGLGAMQLLTGLKRLGWIGSDLTDAEETNISISIIWCVTAVATISVVSGLKMGIQFLSNLGFGLGMVLLFLVLAMENTKFLFNLLIQTVGYYFQWCIFQIPFWTDAFGQLEHGEGRATDGNAAATWWMNGWTVFYMAWWTTWAAFVGLFLARISRGRTIRSVVLYSFIAPLIYAFLWFCTFGGAGLRQERQARELDLLGIEYFDDNTTFLVDGSSFCYNVPQQDVVVDNTTIFTNTLPGITPVCRYDTTDSTASWFNVMYSFSYPDSDGFGGFGGFMTGLSMVAIAVYFTTSSDSGSLIVDHLAANGHEHHHAIQRIFWALTEGAVATALLTAGGKDALSALQAASIVFGLPFNVLLFLMMICIVRMCERALKDDREDLADKSLPEPGKTSFIMPIYGGVLNIFEFIVSFGSVHPDRVARGMDLPTVFHITEFIVGLLFPFWSVYRILNHLNDDYGTGLKVVMTLSYLLLFVGSVVLWALGTINTGFVAFGWCSFFLNACILTSIRMVVRARYGLDGNVVGDFVATSFFYPQALCQMLLQCEEGTPVAGPNELFA